jgi:Holliday junction resolvase RusA-like endonuclease
VNHPHSWFVPGLPATAGSKRGYPVPRRGRIGVAIVDNDQRGKWWRGQVQAYTNVLLPEDWRIIDGPLKMRLTFYMPRPKSHTRPSGELSAKGERTPHPIGRPDALKMARAVEDALTGIVYTDDARIVDGRQVKAWAVGEVGVEITVEEI